MTRKQRKRMISLLLVFLLVLSSIMPYTVYAGGGPSAGSNDSTPSGQQKPANYNMHGWGMMVTLYSNGVDSSSIKDYILKTYPNFDSKLLGNIISKVYGLQQV